MDPLTAERILAKRHTDKSENELYALRPLCGGKDITDWIQGLLDTLNGLFDRVGLHTNVRNTFRMLFRPYHAVGTQLDAAYERQMMG